MRLNGIDVHRWSLTQRDLRGTWNATLRCDEPVEEGAGTLDDGNGNEWLGTIVRVTELGVFTMVDFVGCPVLNAETSPRFYAGGANGESVLADYAADAGATPDATTPLARVPQWRARGDILSVELDRLAKALALGWRISMAGIVTMAPLAGDAAAPGILLDSSGTHRRYVSEGLPELVGATVDGWTIGQALLAYDGTGEPSATVWQSSLSVLPAPNAIAGTVITQSGNRVDVRLDSSVVLAGIPLWSAAGYVPTLKAGARVIILDLADDPRATIALSGAFDAPTSRVDIGGGSDSGVAVTDLGGRALRYGDTVMMPLSAGSTLTPFTLAGPPYPVDASKVRP